MLHRLPAELLVAGTVRREIYEGRDAFIAGMTADQLEEGCRSLSSQIGVSFRCSAGLAHSGLTGEPFPALYQRTDEALYRAKSRGKCQFVWAE